MRSPLSIVFTYHPRKWDLFFIIAAATAFLAAEIRRRCRVVVCRFTLHRDDSLLQQVGDANDTPPLTTAAPGRRANDNINFINSFLQLGVQ